MSAADYLVIHVHAPTLTGALGQATCTLAQRAERVASAVDRCFPADEPWTVHPWLPMDGPIDPRLLRANEGDPAGSLQRVLAHARGTSVRFSRVMILGRAEDRIKASVTIELRTLLRPAASPYERETHAREGELKVSFSAGGCAFRRSEPGQTEEARRASEREVKLRLEAALDVARILVTSLCPAWIRGHFDWGAPCVPCNASFAYYADAAALRADLELLSRLDVVGETPAAPTVLPPKMLAALALRPAWAGKAWHRIASRAFDETALSWAPPEWTVERIGAGAFLHCSPAVSEHFLDEIYDHVLSAERAGAPPAEAEPRLVARCSFPCSDSSVVAGVVTLRPPGAPSRPHSIELTGFSLTGDTTWSVAAREVDALRVALLEANAPALYRYKRELVPFFCEPCGRCYAVGRWQAEHLSATSVDGVCPSGHRRRLCSD